MTTTLLVSPQAFERFTVLRIRLLGMGYSESAVVSECATILGIETDAIGECDVIVDYTKREPE